MTCSNPPATELRRVSSALHRLFKTLDRIGQNLMKINILHTHTVLFINQPSSCEIVWRVAAAPSIVLRSADLWPPLCAAGQATSEPDESLLIKGSGGISLGGLKSVLEDTVSPAFGATIIIIITVIVSGSTYLCFLKYVCGGCCKPMQVAPTVDVDPNKVEEQV